MPTYDYECSKCKHTFEEFQSITSEPGAECPKCGSKARRLISGGAGIIFKGSGFYTTDYRKSSASNGKSSPSEPKSGESSKDKSSDSGKSESKPSEKTSNKAG